MMLLEVIDLLEAAALPKLYGITPTWSDAVSLEDQDTWLTIILFVTIMLQETNSEKWSIKSDNTVHNAQNLTNVTLDGNTCA